MKIIEDLNIFKGLTPSLYCHREEYYYYCTRHHEKSEEFYVDSPPSGALLWCKQRLKGRLMPGNHHLRLKQHGFLAIINILSGSLYYRCDSTTYLVETGDTILMPPNSDNEYLTGPTGEAEVSVVLMDGPLLAPILKETGLDKVSCLHHDNPDHIEKYFIRMSGLLRLTPENTVADISSLCFDILQELAKVRSMPAINTPWAELIDFMNINFNRKLSIDELTAIAGCGRTKLNRWFLKHFNLTPHRYIVRLRMCHAAGLLLESEMSIKEISILSGYNNPLNFSTEFKKFFNCSPRQFRTSSFAGNQ